MAFIKKIWKNRQAQYNSRYNITPQSDGTSELERVWGSITELGDSVNATTMNDLENRIESGFNDVDQKIQSAIGDAIGGSY